MLEIIRRKQKSILVQIVFWAIIATFVGTIFLVWGKGSDSSGNVEDFAAKVNDTKISLNDYQRSYENIYRMYQSLYGEAFTPAVEKTLNLRKVALDSLIDQTLLQQESEKMKVDVSKKEIVDAIAKIPAFQVDGSFNRDRYIQVLRAQRLSPDEFEIMQLRELVVDKTRQALEGKATASDDEINAEYKERNEKVNLELLRIDPSLFEGRVKVDPAALETFFAPKKEEFRLPETVKISYALIDTKSFAAKAEPTDADLEKYYQRHIDRFEVPEQVRAAHILIRVPQDASAAVKAEKKKIIDALRERAVKGEDFAALARANSEDPGSGAQGGDLGFFGRGMMVAPFENAAFALGVGEISPVVTTDFGYHLVKVSERHDAQIKPLEAVKEQVKAGARDEKGREMALEKAMDLFNINRKGGSLDAVVKELGATVQTSEFFSQEKAVVAGTALSKELTNAIFSLQNGDLGRPALLPQGVLVYTLKEKRAAHTPELSEVRPAVEAAYRKEKAKDLARSEANVILAEVRNGGALPTVAQKHSLAVTESGLFARSRTFFVPMVGASEELTKAAFNLTAASPVPGSAYEVDGFVIVAKLKERQNAEAAGLTASVRDEMSNSVIERKKKEILEKALKDLREKAQIVYSAAVAADQKGS